MIERPASVCDNCPAWTALAPELAAAETTEPADMHAQMATANLRETAAGIAYEAHVIDCQSKQKAFYAKPAGELAVGSPELAAYVSQCPAIVSYLNKKQGS